MAMGVPECILVDNTKGVAVRCVLEGRSIRQANCAALMACAGFRMWLCKPIWERYIVGVLWIPWRINQASKSPSLEKSLLVPPLKEKKGGCANELDPKSGTVK